MTGTLPTGLYDLAAIAFLSLHGPSLDVRGAYTYFDPKTGFEASAALGMTFNYINTETDYQSGNELHFEWDLNEHFQSGFSVGIGGYIYDQVTPDHGPSTPILGSFEGRDVAAGPLIGYTFKLMDKIPVQLQAPVVPRVLCGAQGEG